MYNETITYYARNPVNKFELEDYTIKFHEDNAICGDDLEVFLKISKKDIIEAYGFTGDTAIITTACASIFGESIIGMSVKEVLKCDYKYVEELIGMEVSTRRKQAAVLGVLTTRNALHTYLKDGKKDTFEDLID